MKKRILSLLLILCMTLSLLPTTALADDGSTGAATQNEACIGETPYDTLAAAVNAAQGGETITLLSNVTLDQTITINKAITINGGGHTITTDGTPAIMFQIGNDKEPLDGVQIKNCKFEIPESNRGTWVAIYVKYVVRNLTISGNTFDIRGGAASNNGSKAFQCIGLAYEDDRYTGAVNISKNTVTSTVKNGEIIFVVGGKSPDKAEASGYTYSIVNLTISGNEVTDNSGENLLVAAMLSNAGNLKVTGNRFLRCRAGLVLATAGENNADKPLAANDIEDILTGNDDCGTTGDVLVLSGKAPLVDADTPLWIPDVAYERIELMGSANQNFAKVGYDPVNGYEKDGGKVPYSKDSNTEPSLYGALSGFVKPGTEITLPRPVREGYTFVNWTVKEEQPEIDHYSDLAGDSAATGTKTCDAGQHYTVNTSVEFIANWEKVSEIPTATPDVKSGYVKVECANTESTHQYKSMTYTPQTGDYEEVLKDSKNIWQDEDGKWTYQIKLDRSKFTGKFNNKYAGHRDLDPDATATMTWKWNGTKWDVVPATSMSTSIGAVIKVTCAAKPVYVYFQPVNTNGTKIILDDAALARLNLTYNSEYKDWFTFGKLMTANNTLETVVPELNDMTKFTRHEHNIGFTQDKQIKWTSLGMVNDGWHYGYSDSAAAYHLNGQLTFYSVAFDANTTDTVTGMPTGGYYLKGETVALTATPARTGYVFAGWQPEVEKVTENAIYIAQWKEDKNNNGVADDEEDKYTVTYTDGVEGEEVFADQVYRDLLSGTDTPAFNGKPERTGYVFTGWDPKVAATVTESVTYVAQWKEDKNNNGVADDEEDKYTVTYTDGVENEEVFADQEYGNLLSGTATPAFKGTPKRDGYVFKGWKPEVAKTVNGDATYTAQWTPRTDLSYTVHYYLKNTTKKVAEDKTVGGQTFKDVVTEKAIRISGYRVYGESEKSITIGTDTNEIIFYYTRAYHPSTPSKPTLNTGDHYAYVMGYPDGTVRPNGTITRAEVSTILFRLLSDKTREEYFTTESSFTDVKAGAWYNNSVATLEKAGVIVDTAKGGAFRPNEAITRAELAAMLAQFADAKPVKGVKFTDVSSDHWAYDAIAIAAKMGWIEGYPDGTFRPDATITRAEMMTLVNRALERVPSDEDHLLAKRAMLTFPDCTPRDWFYIAVQEATNSHAYERAATEKNGDEQWTKLISNPDWTKFEH